MSRYNAKCAGKSIKFYGNVIQLFSDAVQFSISEWKQIGSQDEVKYKNTADVPFQWKNISVNFSGNFFYKQYVYNSQVLLLKYVFISVEIMDVIMWI